MKKPKALTLTDALVAEGVTAERLARVISRNLGGKNSLKAADMAMKVRGDYRINYVISGAVDHRHAHAHLDITQDEARDRMKLLRDRIRKDKALEDAVDVIVTPSKEKTD